MKRLYSGLLAVPMAILVMGTSDLLGKPAVAQNTQRSIRELYTDLQAAVCVNDWDGALQVISPMIASDDITSTYREELIRFRQQLQNWRATGATVPAQAECDRRSTAPTSSPPAASTPRSQPTPASAPVTAPASNPLTPTDSAALTLQSQCLELGDIVNWVDSEAFNLSRVTDYADLNALLTMLSSLANLSDRAVRSLQTVRLGDPQLRTYQQNFISVYSGFGQATRGFVSAANSGNYTTMESSNMQIQRMADQEASLISQVNAYCGQPVIQNGQR